jgi:hypothetical protein
VPSSCYLDLDIAKHDEIRANASRCEKKMQSNASR